MKKILLSIVIVFEVFSAHAHQCKYKSTEQIYNESRLIFLAKVLSSDKNGVVISVVKPFKGNVKNLKFLSTKPGLDTDYSDIADLTIGHIYLFSSRNEVEGSTGKLMFELCNWVNTEENSRSMINWLENKINPATDRKPLEKDSKKK